MDSSFNIRVYGVLVENGKVLISDEVYDGRRMTKFPGGGLELGEGIGPCLVREWMEELQTEIEVGEILYINPFLLYGTFFPDKEILAIYFNVKRLSPIGLPISGKPYDFPDDAHDAESFRWVPLQELKPEEFTYITDQEAAKCIIAKAENFIHNT